MLPGRNFPLSFQPQEGSEKCPSWLISEGVCSALILFSGISHASNRLSVRHSSHFLGFHLYLTTFPFGTYSVFWDFTCTRLPFRSARIPFSGISHASGRLSVRHLSYFPEFHMPPTAFLFGTHSIFWDITCNRPPFCSALIPFSGISPVLPWIFLRKQGNGS